MIKCSENALHFAKYTVFVLHAIIIVTELYPTLVHIGHNMHMEMKLSKWAKALCGTYSYAYTATIESL